MQPINAISLTSTVNDWLANSRHPRILHVFDHACNLINERREVLSVVTPQIGNGPFNLVVEANVLLSGHLSLTSLVSNLPNQLCLGDLAIHTTDGTVWNPRPNWKRLHEERDHIPAQRIKLPITNYSPPILQFSNSLVSSLSTSLANADISSTLTVVSKLAGLGQGLTPAGDDFIMGALYAAWIIHPPEVASVLAREIAETAAPRTTSLSAAWLRSAGKGEAGILWHDLFNALSTSKNYQLPITNLLATGETSGADALTGFIDTFISYAEREAKSCPS